MVEFLLGFLFGFGTAAIVGYVIIGKKKENTDVTIAEEEAYEEHFRKWEEDMMRQMRNILRYDGTEFGQEERENE